MATLKCNLSLCVNNKKGICKSISHVDIAVEWVQTQVSKGDLGQAFRIDIANPKFVCPVSFVKGETGEKAG
jgi:hypothetical protein